MGLLIKDSKLINKLNPPVKPLESPKPTRASEDRRKDDDRKLFLLTGMAIDMDKRIDELEKKRTIIATVARNDAGKMQKITMRDQNKVVATASLNRAADGNITTITITKL